MFRKLMAMLCVIAATLMQAAVLAHASEVKTIAGIGSHGSADGAAAQFNMPLGVASGPNGEVLVADTFNSLIRTVEEHGFVTSLTLRVPENDMWGFPMGGYVDEALSRAIFNRPSDFAAGFHGWVFVADTHNHAVRVIVGDRVYTMAGGIEEGFVDGSRH